MNDAWHLHALLRQSLRMEEEQLRILTDEGQGPQGQGRATKANILSNFQWPGAFESLLKPS